MSKKTKYEKYTEAEETIENNLEEITQESDGIDEALGFVEEPQKEKSLAEEADDEFMDTISETPKKLTAKERAKKIAELEEDIANATARMTEIEPIAELSKNAGFRVLVEEVKGSVCKSVHAEEIKEFKDGGKVLEAVLLTEKTVNRYNFAYDERKASIKGFEASIVELKAGQLTIFDGGKTDNEVEENKVIVPEKIAVGK